MKKMIDRVYYSDKEPYNGGRYIRYLKDQKKNYKKYRPQLSPIADEELKSKKKSAENSKYVDRVNELISCAVRSPRADEFVDTRFKSFKHVENANYKSYTLIEFDRPEATHRIEEYDDKDGNEAWSKDIDRENRLIYRIYDDLKIIHFISIEEHDLDEDKIATKLQSDTYSHPTIFMQEIFNAQDNGETDVLDLLTDDIYFAIENGVFEIDEYSIESDEDGIRIYDEINREITYVEETKDGFCLSSEPF
jgi:Txe/YoeB family toxin of Txe-Axe toxin-antitoxin module